MQFKVLHDDSQMEIVIASSPVDAGIGCWVLGTGVENLRYRSCSSPPHGLTCIAGRFLASSQIRDSKSSSGSILYWSWNKPHVEVKSFPSEPIGPLLSNSEGVYLFGGGASGNIYMWEVFTGKLIKKWQAHYRSVTCLVFSDDESLLVSGSEDGGVRVWCLMRMFDDMANLEMKQPYQYSFQEHSLRVTDLVSGNGLSNSIVISSSEDHTCKIWSLSRGQLLRSITFPCIINAVSIDPGEYTFYAGGRDGKIYIAALNAESASSSTCGLHIVGCLSDQSKSINCLGFSTDGVTLVSGSEDGIVRAWDTRNRQAIRIFKHAKGPVNNVLVIKSISNSEISSSKKRANMPMPPPLEKHANAFDGNILYNAVVLHEPCQEDKLDKRYRSYLVMKNQIEELQKQGSSGATEMELERLKEEVKRSSQMVQDWKKLYKDLHKVCVDELLDNRSQLGTVRRCTENRPPLLN